MLRFRKNCSYTFNRSRAPLVFATDREQTMYSVCMWCEFGCNSLLEREDFSIFRPCAVWRKLCSISITEILKRLRIWIWFIVGFLLFLLALLYFFVTSCDIASILAFSLLSRFTVSTMKWKCAQCHTKQIKIGLLHSKRLISNFPCAALLHAYNMLKRSNGTNQMVRRWHW